MIKQLGYIVEDICHQVSLLEYHIPGTNHHHHIPVSDRFPENNSVKSDIRYFICVLWKVIVKMSSVMGKCALRSLLLSYQKKDWIGRMALPTLLLVLHWLQNIICECSRHMEEKCFSSQQTFLSLLRGHNSYFRYQSIVSLVLLRGYNSYHAYWVIVSVIPKEGLAGPHLPILLWVWQQQRSRGIFSHDTAHIRYFDDVLWKVIVKLIQNNLYFWIVILHQFQETGV